MHLANGDHTLRYGGVAQEKNKVKVSSNGLLDVNENGSYINGNTQTNGRTEEPNQVELTSFKDQSPEVALDAILTAWTILMQRYQRDVFHQFSWGIKGAGSNNRQLIPASELKLESHSSAASLARTIRDVRLKDVSIDGSSIFLNDGTKEEVRRDIQCYTLSHSVANHDAVDF